MAGIREESFMCKTIGIILAAGRGTRMQSEKPKQLMEISGKPMFLYSVELFTELCDRTLVVTGKTEKAEVEEALKKAGFSDVPVVLGGENRYESSRNGIQYALWDAELDSVVLIHDAARPLVTKEVINDAISSAMEKGSGVAAVPSKDTVKVADADGKVLTTPDRRTLYQIQTPQAFSMELVATAYQKAFSGADLSDITDDASVVERFTDHPVYLSKGDYENIKVTTPMDLLLAEAILAKRN